MIAIVQENWLAVAPVLLIVLLVAWWLWGRSTTTIRQRHHAPDALDDGAAPALRNQAFIDAPSAAAAVVAPLAATGPNILGGVSDITAGGGGGDFAGWGGRSEIGNVASRDTERTTTPADDLTRIKGVGGKLSARLAELGVTHFAQIAAWGEADLARIDAALGAFAGRPTRDNWVGQCGYLATDDIAGYQAVFGKL